MSLTPSAQRLADIAATGPSMAELSFVDVRAQIESLSEQFGIGAEVERTVDLVIPAEGADLPARSYHPHILDDSMPVLVYFHGGGWASAGLT